MTAATAPGVPGTRVPVAAVCARLAVVLLGAFRAVSRRAREAASPAMDAAGLAAIVVGAFLLAPWVGWMALGAALLVLNLSLNSGKSTGADG